MSGSKTTCELYYAALMPQLLPSVMGALHMFWHLHSFSGESYPKVPQRSLKNYVRDRVEDTLTTWRLFRKYEFKNHQKCDIIFNFFNSHINFLTTQRQLAKQCQLQGLRTGIVQPESLSPFAEFDDRFSITRGYSVSKQFEQAVFEQCLSIVSQLKDATLLHLDFNEVHSRLVLLATEIERQVIWLKQLFELKKPKLVILTNGKNFTEFALEIACADTNTPLMMIPHGFPQRSSHLKIVPAFIMSYASHHDNYWKKLSLDPDRVKSLGWLEPKVVLSNRLDTLINEKFTDREEKYKILFLSQLSGAEMHRCKSLVDRLPLILKALDKMDEVETITLRLRPYEVNNILIKTFLALCGCSKLRISSTPAIADDLQQTNTLMSFSSTGLLYGPYLGMRALEIRDRTINSLWEESVLPSEQVYQIGEEFDPDDFSKFVAESQFFNKQELFYNCGSELESFSKYLSTII